MSWRHRVPLRFVGVFGVALPDGRDCRIVAETFQNVVRESGFVGESFVVVVADLIGDDSLVVVDAGQIGIGRAGSCNADAFVVPFAINAKTLIKNYRFYNIK